MDKEKWTEKVLLSLDQQKIVEPDKALFDKILLKIEDKNQQVIPLFIKLSIAASLLVLLSLNISFLNNSLNKAQASDQEVLLNEFDNNLTNQLYIK